MSFPFCSAEDIEDSMQDGNDCQTDEQVLGDEFAYGQDSGHGDFLRKVGAGGTAYLGSGKSSG
jgi:hypothetical protein